VQAFAPWSPPGGTLGQIVAETGARLDELRRRRAALDAAAAQRTPPPSFAAALAGADVAVIAELKRRSPSRGEINSALSPAAQATAYERGGAAAISVLTEPRHFGGSADDLAAVRDSTRLPVLKKDFHLDAIQLVEARGLGASAVLLIARALEPRLLVALVSEACRLELEPLVEVRTERELDVALSTEAPVIGVNVRDLETLAMDFSLAEWLLPMIPRGRVAVAESGVKTSEDVRRAGAAGADAVLVGSVLSAAGDPAAAVRELTGIPRSSRAA
jgi:indole-3-glycerol phosphate synthase